ncbi:Hypothetical predicted protein [Podarcis lilfordi]|uniref:Uncharacterized protein n=1 Tax=Podarcis lilfordi TaxID=74358 RepID=A0AA35K322_9SAUR|nr:Hypothetical predicted protein [Podarcis lilfordi]
MPIISVSGNSTSSTEKQGLLPLSLPALRKAGGESVTVVILQCILMAWGSFVRIKKIMDDPNADIWSKLAKAGANPMCACLLRNKLHSEKCVA